MTEHRVLCPSYYTLVVSSIVLIGDNLKLIQATKIDSRLFQILGKARQGDEPSGPRYHLLPYHCLDVAAVGHILLKQNQSYCENLTRLTGLSSQQFIPWYTFLLALHDIGKFADSFQNLNPDVLQTLQGRISDRQYGLRHDSLGLFLWEKHLRCQFQEHGLIPQPGGSRRRRNAEQPIDTWMSAMVGHHGQPPKSDNTRTVST